MNGRENLDPLGHVVKWLLSSWFWLVLIVLLFACGGEWATSPLGLLAAAILLIFSFASIRGRMLAVVLGAVVVALLLGLVGVGFYLLKWVPDLDIVWLFQPLQLFRTYTTATEPASLTLMSILAAVVFAIWIGSLTHEQGLESALDTVGIPFAANEPLKMLFGVVFGLAATGGIAYFGLQRVGLNVGDILSSAHLAGASRIDLILPVLSTLVLVIVLETVRAYYLLACESRWGMASAYVLVSGAFAAATLFTSACSILGLAGTFLMGLFLSWAYFRTGSAWFAIAFYAIWRIVLGHVLGIQRLGGYNISVIPLPEEHRLTETFGGPFGPEGSALGIAAILLTWVIMYLWMRIGGDEESQSE
ncbi:CPBP family intramembrane metalloprotease [bacterium]|nr:CPBP family intramembrane metalloprotease [bacterium]